MKNDDLISRSALKKDLLDRSFFPAIVKAAVEKAPTVDAVEVDKAMAWLEGYTMTDTEKLTELLRPWIAHLSLSVAKDLIANGVTFAKDTDVPSKWISVEDDKPKRRGEYFVSYVFADCDMRFYGAAFWNDDLETNGYVTGPHFSNEGVNGMKVTHWMEIQKLPVGNPSVSLEADSSLCTREPLNADI